MEWWTVILTIAGGASCIYLYITRNYNYFEKLGIPFVKPTPIFGNLTRLIFNRKTIPDVIQEIYNCHPDAKYVGLYDFLTPIILIKDPELLGSITIRNFDSFPNHRMFVNSPTEPLFQKNLLALQDDKWRDMRAILSPAFTTKKMKAMFNILSQYAVHFVDHLKNLNLEPDAMNMKDAFERYTLDVIASSAFGLSVNSMKDRDNDFYKMGKDATDFSGSRINKYFLFKSCPWLAKFFNIKFLSSKTSDFFMNAIETTIATREAEGIVRQDMIQLMIQARDGKDKSALSSEDMAAQAFFFLIGGFESPSTTMSFAAQELALNPDIQVKLQAEIDRVLDNSNGEVSYEDLNKMKYLDAVICETLRMYPPVNITDRIGSKSFTLPPALPGLKPVELKPGQNIWIPCWSFHYDPKYFPDPEKFDPERFSDENRSKISPLTYFPFGLGPRICIAKRFALMEVKLVLFYLLASCSLLPSANTQSPIKLDRNSFIVMPEGGFWLKLKPRK